MTLTQLGEDRLRLVECPFCGEDLRDREPARHLEACDAYRDALADPTGRR